MDVSLYHNPKCMNKDLINWNLLCFVTHAVCLYPCAVKPVIYIPDFEKEVTRATLIFIMGNIQPAITI